MIPDAELEILEDLLSQFSQARLRVSGKCMAPALPEGSTVLLEAGDRRPPRWGDVVLVRQPAGLRLHRLIWCPRGSRWRTKADHAPSLDAAITPRDVLATVVSVADSSVTVRDRGRAARSLVRAIFTRLRAFSPAA